ncbi:MAG TPA: prepilin peptidase [Chromatiaceae bacterium]|jgi:leader peptidase (prepilin peptidase)/N-methyltransferase|nr:prepilin peptidase [Chromatiaceae bacterium]HIB83045.1 prepilin peptidase [Chromatiaceae bacterium]HIN81488.1 prepilin peptidase [Chromatiales bacterium]HIO14015.1 prepilin peptidase [Chromatiales bacterium]HIO54986.1 prepilin peptidase [Chromatiales bacterium]
MLILDYLAANPTAFIILCGLIGLTVGSFLNVVIHRLPIMIDREWQFELAQFNDPETELPEPEPFNLSRPRSRCPHCGHMITALENIPVISWLLLGRKCSNCQQPIAARYPIIELFTALASLMIAWHFGFGIQAAAALALTWALIAASMIDFDHQLLPDSITLPFLWLGLVLNLNDVFTDGASSVVGAVAGYLSLWTLYWLFKLATGKEGMGYGDFKLLALLGAWMGWQMLPVIVLLSSLVGAVVGIGLIVLRGRDRNIPIPFGPYLAGAGWIALLWGQEITETYLNTVL